MTGASGMVGGGVLLECIDDPSVESVLVVGRTPCGVTHPKLTEVLHRDFYDFAPLRPVLTGRDACFFCLGTTSAGKTEADYTRQTYDLTLGAARVMAQASPGMTFVYVSGRGTDSTEKGRVMWARVKGRTENALLALPFRAAYMLRPGVIEPLRGARSRTPLYHFFYVAFAWLWPILRRVWPDSVTTTVAVGRAMLALAAHGDAKKVLEPADINRLAAAG